MDEVENCVIFVSVMAVATLFSIVLTSIVAAIAGYPHPILTSVGASVISHLILYFKRQ